MVWGESSSSFDYGGSEDTADYEDVVVNQDHIYFVIDCRERMMETNGAGESHLLSCFRTILYIMKQKIIASDKSSLGIMLVGTARQSQNVHCCEMLKLSEPSAEIIRDIQELVNNFDEEFQCRFAGAQPPENHYFCLKEALWACHQGFIAKAPKSKTTSIIDKRVWVFTNDDDPNSESEFTEERKTLLKVVGDAAGMGTEISLWCIDRGTDDPFNIDIFYAHLLRSGEEGSDDEEDSQDATERGVSESLCDRIMHATSTGFDMSGSSIKAKFWKKRQLFTGYLDLGLGRVLPSNDRRRAEDTCPPGRISVTFYSELKECKKPSPVKLYSVTNEPVKSKTRFIDAETGELVESDEIKPFFTTDGNSTHLPSIPMTHEELVSFRNRGESAEAAVQDAQYSHNMLNKLGKIEEKEMKVHASSSQTGLRATPPMTHSAQPQDFTVQASASSYTQTHSNLQQQSTFNSLEIKFFAPQSELLVEFNIGPPLFVYPDETKVQGSTALFTALLEDLHRKELIAFAKLNGKDEKSEQRMTAMLPQLEEIGEDGSQTKPAGFQLVMLPFRNEIRVSPMPPLEMSVRPELATVSNKLVDSLPLCKPQGSRNSYGSSDAQEFDYQNLEGPALQHFYSVLQAVALNETKYSWERKNDSMNPSSSKMASAKDTIVAFKKELNMPPDAARTALGKRATGGTGPNSKAAKKARADELSDAAIKKILEEVSKDADDFTVPGLKDILKQLGLPVSGKKAELVDRIIQGAKDLLINRGAKN